MRHARCNIIVANNITYIRTNLVVFYNFTFHFYVRARGGNGERAATGMFSSIGFMLVYIGTLHVV